MTTVQRYLLLGFAALVAAFLSGCACAGNAGTGHRVDFEAVRVT